MLEAKSKIGDILVYLLNNDSWTCGNHKGINLLNEAYKMCVKVVTNGLKPIADTKLERVVRNHGRKSCSDEVFIVKLLTGKIRVYSLETNVLFITISRLLTM